MQKLKDQRDRDYADLRNNFARIVEKYLLLNDRGSKEAIKILKELDSLFANNTQAMNYLIVNQKSIDGSIPLLRAIVKQDVPLVKILLGAGANPSIENGLPMKKAEAIGNPAIIHFLKNAILKNDALMIEN